MRDRLALALLEEDHGREFAREVARHLALFMQRARGEVPFATQPQRSPVSPIESAQRWCHDHLDGDLRVAALAKRIAMSERNFLRVFRAETGRTPAEFVSSIRLQAARRLLEESDLPVKVAAQRCGFGSVAAMRRTFLREIGVTPAAYREKFSAAREA
jgi:transcriptional regulator GlxA family with amidase domain